MSSESTKPRKREESISEHYNQEHHLMALIKLNPTIFRGQTILFVVEIKWDLGKKDDYICFSCEMIILITMQVSSEKDLKFEDPPFKFSFDFRGLDTYSMSIPLSYLMESVHRGKWRVHVALISAN